MAEIGAAERIDAAIADFFSSWNIFTTLLVVLLAALLAYPLLTSKDPDTHPFLLARQSQIAPIRQPGESAVYRAIDIPHGYPLRAGLGVKDAGTPRWSAGRPGDLRDIWRQAVRGVTKEDGTPTGEKGKVQTVLGREKIVDHNLDDLTLGINVIGQYVKRNNGQSVAVSLSNSPELLSSIFAGSFYGFSTILLPFGLTPDKLGPLLSHTSVDHLIAEAGSLDLNAVLAANKNIKTIIWVTKAGSQHLDWSSDSPKEFTVTSWQGLTDSNRRTTNSEVLPLDKDSQVPPVSIFTHNPGGSYDLIKYTSENLISAIAAIQATLPRTYKLSVSDTVLPTTSLTDSYTLSWAFAALYSHSTLALNSVAGDEIKLDVATAIAKPTVLITSPKAVASYLSDPRTIQPSGLSKFNDTRNLQAGNLPTKKRTGPNLPGLSALRILLIPQAFISSTHPTPTLKSADLHALRLLLGARIGYALTTPLVAGAVAQTNILDYRDKGRDVVCYGAPLSSVEINLEGDEDVVASSTPKGKLSVKGPAVVGGGKVTLDITVQIDKDHTLVLP